MWIYMWLAVWTSCWIRHTAFKEYDVWYAENWNLALDFKIIFLTVFNAIKGEKNAF